jgi:hypothetical protein
MDELNICIMTREEALQAMIDGEKVTHRFFASNEYIYMKAQNIFTEEGYDMGTVHDEFWWRRGDNRDGYRHMWHEDWSIYNDENDETEDTEDS